MHAKPQLTKLARLMLWRMAQHLGRQPTPEEVIRAARPSDSPLHSYFEWDEPKTIPEQRRRRMISGDSGDA